MIESIAEKLKKFDFKLILGSSMINKIVMLLYNVLIVRILEPEEFGIFSSIWNTVSMVAIFSGLGLSETMLQFSSETQIEEERNCYAKFTLIIGVLSSFVFAVFLIIYALIFEQSVIGSSLPLAVLALILVPQYIFQNTTMYFRSSLQNRQYALVINCNSIFFTLFAIMGAMLFGLYGTIFGKYFGFIISAVIGLFLMKDNIRAIVKAKSLTLGIKWQMIKYGLTITLTNAVSQVLYMLDIFLIGNIARSAILIASYKTATIIPFALNFLPGIVITFIYPHFARHKDDIPWLRKNYYLILKCMFVINIIITVIGYILAPQIINSLFGSKYADSIVPFRILMISYFFSGTFRTISGNVLAMLRMVNINLILGIISCIVNIFLDIIFIRNYGSVGAAWATLLVTILSGIISTGYIAYIFRKADK